MAMMTSAARPPRLEIGKYLGCQSGQSTRGRSVFEHAETDRVDPTRQIFQRAVPPKRDRSTSSNCLTAGALDDEDLKVSVVGEQRPEVESGVVPVMVVLGPQSREAII